MTVCRECDAVLLATPLTCPGCRAQRPGARLAGPAVVPAHRGVPVRLAGAAGALAVPLVLAAHTAAAAWLPTG
jgi:hypothetical protein